MYNVLICDDQPDIVNALKIYLTPEGYNLFEAFTGAQAVEIAKNNDMSHAHIGASGIPWNERQRR